MLRRSLSLSFRKLGAAVSTIPEPLISYSLDGSDDITRVGGDDYRMGAACADAVGSFFDGSTQSYDASSDVSVLNTIGTSDFSVGYFFNGYVADTSDIVAWSGTGTDCGFRYDGEKRGRLNIAGTNYNTTGYDILNGENNFILWIISNTESTVKCYLNQTLILNTTLLASTNITGNTQFRIGASPAGGTRFAEGMIDGVMIWGEAISDYMAERIGQPTCEYKIEETSNLIAYYDPQRQDTITASAGAVSALSDISVNANDLEQTNASNRMITGTFDYNGINILRGGESASSQYLENSSVDLGTDSNGSYTFFVVPYIFDVDSALDSVFSIQGVTTSRDFQFISVNNTGDFRGGLQLLNPTVTSNFPSPSGDYRGITEITLDWASGEMKGYKNGVLQATGTYDTTKIEGIVDLKLWQKEVPSATTSPNGGLGAFVAIKGIDQTTRDKVRGALAWQYGEQGNLPADDPYKLQPPTDTVDVKHNNVLVTHSGSQVTWSR